LKQGSGFGDRVGSEGHHPISRRAFLARAGSMALALPAASAILAACSKPGASSAAGSTRVLARPDEPVTLPLRGDPIPTSTPIEEGATLQVFNWTDYIYRKTLKGFEDKYSCSIDYASFNTLEEALQKVTSGALTPDVYFPGPAYLSRLVYEDLLQPLNHELLPNMEANVWKYYWDPGPWYDVGWRYSVPYTVLTTGTAYRRDRVHDDEAAAAGYDLLWDPAYRGKVTYYDSYRDAIAMAILRNGGTDVNSGDPDTISAAKDAILELIRNNDARLTYNGVYAKLPEGEYTVGQSWSGDIVSAQWFLPKGTSTDILGYWYPNDRPGLSGNDIISIPAKAKHPRLAHEFINYLLDAEVGFTNFAYWTGYMPPFRSIDPATLVDQGVIPKNLSAAVVSEETMQAGLQLAELRPEVDDLWIAAWDEIKSGG
jgi:spermidine/putrescine transport system substrate-binding protein